MKIELKREKLHFKIPARTSRGEYTEHDMLLVKLSDGGRSGIGECAPLPDLSCDRDAYKDLMEVYSLLRNILDFNGKDVFNPYSNKNCCFTKQHADCKLLKSIANQLHNYPALLFAVESALAELNQDPELYNTDFAKGKEGIPINGLVWMADRETMFRQMEEKIAAGYRCIKLKIGAIKWEEEISLIKSLRSRFTENELQLRVDANGAFQPEEAKEKLDELSLYKIHSIEQPIRQGCWGEMARLCKESKIAIALDEELIGINDTVEKERMLDFIRPRYIVVKPTLHGGMTGSRKWIELAQKRGIRSWITSALESNIGLKNVALLAASIYSGKWELPQGLGTGLLFTNNFETGVHIKDGHIWIS